MNTAATLRRAVTLGYELRPVLRAHAWLLAIVALHFALALTLYHRYPAHYRNTMQAEEFLGSLVIGPICALTAYALYVMLCVRPAHLLRYLGRQLRQYLTRQRLLFALPVLLMMPLFASAFTIIKAAVPLFQPFAWDSQLSQLDAALHGGVQPWVWLQMLFGHPLLTAVVNLNYHLWFFIMFATLYWMAFSMEHARLRMQFLLSFVLSWILLGNVLAICFSSVGPCYYALVLGGPDPYAGLLHYLQAADRQIPVLALDVQKLLWNDYKHQIGVSGLSISAMPSMHVASSMLLALLGWRLNRKAGIALSVFALLILAGSVHLGWHYAVDGYAGALGALLIWLAVGKLLALQEPAPRRLNLLVGGRIVRSVLQRRLP
ncbi:phosphatase PAP2 family protein [Massilia sp. erpn]|uniref:phosphatase PAP2 family protein n=1 Tax=Massilia sp. erpn TaxID=2738142 RepID=UPI0021062E51|nr:phosphatase PAP2 family protein [Massilia sp. erpn]UTY58814.1 phosphoesterase PA-phosphatase [Massilia sp. erpn]